MADNCPGEMTVSGKGSVQDAYLKEVSDKGDTIRISLIGGKEVRGAVKAFDAFTILVTTRGMDILVYKSAVAAIGPASAPAAE
jgi:host factor-I protein